MYDDDLPTYFPDLEPDDSTQLLTYDSTDDYLTTRATAVGSIESTIHEIGSMYSRVVSLVNQQEEVVMRIDSQLDDTEINMERGRRELLTYFDRISGNSMLIVKVFAILILFLMIFLIFL